MTAQAGVWRDRRVCAWALGEGVSDLGDEIWLIALAWTAVRLGGGVLAGAVLAAAAVPRAVLMLAGGGLADRVDLRRLMLACDLARVGVLGGGLAVVGTLGLSAAALVVMSVLFGAADAAYTPASRAFPVQLVDGDALIALASGRQLIGRLATLAGASAGGAIVAWGGLRAAMLADAASFAVIAVVLAGLRPRHPRPPRDHDSLLTEVRSGLRYVRRSPAIRDLTLTLSALNVFVTPVTAVGLAQLAHYGGWGATRLGMLTGLIGAGAVAGTAAAMMRRPARPLPPALVVLLVQALALASLGLDPFAGAAAAMLVVGATAGYASPLLAGVFQQTVARDYLGRCASLTALGDAALLPGALLAFGGVGGALGPGAACALFGAGFAGLLTRSLVAATRAPVRRADREEISAGRSACPSAARPNARAPAASPARRS